MFNSPVLDVLVGMVFVFSLFSILVTQINSFIGNFLLLRARHLRGAIDEIIQDEKVRAKLITHPLIRFTKEKAILPQDIITDEQAEYVVNSAIENVTWIDPNTFAKVLTNIITSGAGLFDDLLLTIYNMPPGEARTKIQTQFNLMITTGTGLDDLRKMIGGVRDDEFREALTNNVNMIYAKLSENNVDPTNMISMMAGLNEIDNQAFRGAMATLLSGISSMDEAQHRIAQWFDDAMGRTTSYFKRTMEYYSVAVGLVIAILLNVDSLFIAQSLWNDPALRDSVVAAAEVAAVDAQLQEQANEGITTNADDPTAGVSSALVAAESTLDDLLALRLPMGWVWQTPESAAQFAVPEERNLYCLVAFWAGGNDNNGGDGTVDNGSDENSNTSNGEGDGCRENFFWLWLTKIMGISATAIAVAQGAPFWFGLLGRISNPRRG